VCEFRLEFLSYLKKKKKKKKLQKLILVVLLEHHYMSLAFVSNGYDKDMYLKMVRCQFRVPFMYCKLYSLLSRSNNEISNLSHPLSSFKKKKKKKRKQMKPLKKNSQGSYLLKYFPQHWIAKTPY
jgi:hypothetical protein